MEYTTSTLKYYRGTTTLGGFGVDVTDLSILQTRLKIGEVYGFDYDYASTVGKVPELSCMAKDIRICGFIQKFIANGEETWYVIGVKEGDEQKCETYTTYHPSRFTVETKREFTNRWKQEDNAKEIEMLRTDKRNMLKCRANSVARKEEYVRIISEKKHFLEAVTKEIAQQTEQINALDTRLLKLGVDD